MNSSDENSTGRKRKSLRELSHGEGTSKKSRPESEETTRRAGSINRMVLKNFMCHSLLEVDLNTVNIIIGQNGSGKSALLTALVVGLGGKASLTNRGTNIKGFIKSGRTSGSVEICLHNGGAMAYRPNVYGSSITIIRHMNASGGSRYQIKGENGQVIATQAKEVTNITTGLNIQVENPVCILNQDTSRNFLSSNDPAHKFTLFMKATKLDALAEEYKTATLNKQSASRILEEKQENLNDLKKELKSLKKKIDDHKSMATIRDNVKMAQCEMLWAIVRDTELELKQQRKQLEYTEKKRTDLLEQCKNRSSIVDGITDKIRTLNQQILELKENMEVQARPQMDAKKMVDDLKVKMMEKRRQRQIAAEVIQSKRRDEDNLQEQIQHAQANMNKAEQAKIEHMRLLTKQNEQLKGIDEHLETMQNDLFQIKGDIGRRNEEREKLQREITQKGYEITNQKTTLNSLKNDSGDTLGLYGRHMPEIKRLIEQHKNQFNQTPRGPLGSYIRFKDKKWAVAIEGYLGPGLLTSFVVDNREDNHLLNSIFDRVAIQRGRPSIITSKFFFKKHDIRGSLVQAPTDCTSLHDALEIDDNIVMNCMIDQRSIESALLIPNNERAFELLSNARNVPRNCAIGITAKGDTFYPDPNFKTYGSRYHRNVLLQVDAKEHIVQMERHIQEVMEQIAQVQQQCNAVEQEIRNRHQNEAQLQEKIMKFQAAKAKIRKQLADLKATAEPEVADVNMLESELTVVKKAIQAKESELVTISSALKEINVAIKENEERVNQLKTSNSNLQERMQTLENQVREENIRKREIGTADEFEKRKVNEFDSKLRNHRTDCELKEEFLQQQVAQASNLGERVESNRSVTDIANVISQLGRSVRRLESDSENIENLTENYTIMREQISTVSNLFTCVTQDVHELNEALLRRKRHYKFTENYFITFIRHSFKKIMDVRKFQGSIDINMIEKKLELHVVPQNGNKGIITTANLSGGERSFSTVAFLYSLWQCMEFPFYFLDEFDVYMDKLNRTKVVNILLHHAETHPQLQFVFLTPQDVSFVKNPNVQILRLQDPKRTTN